MDGVETPLTQRLLIEMVRQNREQAWYEGLVAGMAAGTHVNPYRKKEKKDG